MRVRPVTVVLVAALGALAPRAAAQECVGFLELLVSDQGTSGVEALDAADLDGDLDIDLLTASYGDGHILWYENDGAGRFVPHVIAENQPGASDVLAVDLDGDGALDVVTAGRTMGRVSWFWSYDEPGRAPVFQERLVTATVSVPLAVFAADLDGDGDNDVLSASFEDDTIAWYESDGLIPPTFIPHDISTTADGAADVFAADVDGDGDIDVLSASRLDGKVVWYENLGYGEVTEDDPEPTLKFTAHTIVIAAGATTVYAADIDGDMDVDVAVGALGNDTVAWYENDGSTPPAFVQHVLPTPVADPTRVVVADVDGNGTNDLLVASRGGDSILWFRDLADPPVVVSAAAVGAQSVAAANLDGSVGPGLDIVSTSSVPGFPATLDKVAWYENQGGTTFPEHQVFGSADGAVATAGADFDGDGLTDVATAGRQNKVAWQRNLGGVGPPFQELPVSSVVGASSLVAVDFDGVNGVDLVSAGAESGVVMWHENDPTGPLSDRFTDRTISSVEASVAAIAVKDVDSDGFLDVLTALPDSDEIAWLRNNQDTPPTFARQVVVDDADGASSVDAGDLDGDGHVDIVTASAEDDTIAWFESDDTSTDFTRHDLSTTSVGASAVLVVDLDRDGDLDVVAGSAGDNTIAWYANDGLMPPTFTRRVVNSGIQGVSSIVAADFDDDGDVDLAATAPGSNAVFWFESSQASGASPFTFTPAFVTASGDLLTRISVADVDGDGLPDIVAGQRRIVSWYRAGHEICQDFDASGDGRIDGVELAWIGRSFGSTSADPAAEWWGPVDYDGNGTIDGSDLAILVTPGVFGQSPDECVYICQP